MADRDTLAFLDDAPLSRAQLIGIWITALLGAVDGYDVLAMSFAAPTISAKWGLDKARLGLVLSSGLVGMAIGSFFISPLADRYGRRPLVLGTLVLMIVGMTMSAFAHSVPELALWRIVAGFGLGALIPINTPLSVEYANAEWRRLALAIMSIGYPLGGTFGGFAAAALLHYADWQSVFFLGASLTALLLVAAWFYLPEPPAYLLARRPPDALARVNDYLRRCGHAPLEALPPAPADVPRHPTYWAIFASGQWRSTIKVAGVNLLYLMTVYYVLSWMPQLVADLGYSSSFATFAAAVAALFGAAASLAMGFVGRALPLRVIATIHMIGLAISTIAFGIGLSNPFALIALAAVLGIFLYAGVVTVYGVIVGSFAPSIRTTGVGFAMGMGRVAGAITPAFAGLMFAAGFTRLTVSIMLAACALVAAAILSADRSPSTL